MLIVRGAWRRPRASVRARSQRRAGEGQTKASAPRREAPAGVSGANYIYTLDITTRSSAWGCGTGLPALDTPDGVAPTTPRTGNPSGAGMGLHSGYGPRESSREPGARQLFTPQIPRAGQTEPTSGRDSVFDGDQGPHEIGDFAGTAPECAKGKSRPRP